MNELRKKIDEICIDYLGPATPMFIARQIKMHLHIEEDELSIQHLEKLAEWIDISGGLIIDKPKAKELADKIRTLEK